MSVLKFNVGDTVYLKSGSSSMTITRIKKKYFQRDVYIIYAEWIYKNKKFSIKGNQEIFTLQDPSIETKKNKLEDQVNSKTYDECVTHLLHCFVSIGVLLVCVTFVIKALLVHDYNSLSILDNFSYIIGALIMFISLVMFLKITLGSIQRLYVSPIVKRKSAPVIVLSGGAMIIGFVMFSFLNADMKGTKNSNKDECQKNISVESNCLAIKNRVMPTN